MTTPWHRQRPRKTMRDFHRPRYGNPMFPRPSLHRGRPARFSRRSSSNGPSGAKIVAAVVGGAVLALAGWLLWGPALRITTIDVHGASPATEDAIRKAVDGYRDGTSFLIMPNANVLVFKEDAVLAAVRKAVFLADAEVRKKLPGTVAITVKEKTPAAVEEHGGRLFAIDAGGFIIRELNEKEMAAMGDLPPGMSSVEVTGLGAVAVDLSQPSAPAAPTVPATTSGAKPTPTAPAKKPDDKKPAPPAPAAPPPPTGQNALPLIIDAAGDTAKPDAMPDPGTQAFAPETMTLILAAAARLPDVVGEPVRWYAPDAATDSVDVTMAGGWHAYLSTTTPFDVQADRLSLILKDKIGAKKPSLDYVDLRYNERIFYRLKDAAP